MEINYKEELKKNGWVLIKNFFDEDLCNELRNSAHLSAENGLAGADILSNKYLSNLFLNNKLINLLTDIIGQKPVYFGDSTFQIASLAGGIQNGFHKDCVDRKNSSGIDWEDDYSIIRIGIYLQDHKNYSEGLVVRDKSHKSSNLSIGKKINVPSKPGDLVIWFLTTTHAGNAKRIKIIDYPVLMSNDESSKLSRKLYHKLPKSFIMPSQKDRIAIFATFGKDDRHLKRYINYLKYRLYMVKILKKINFDQDVVSKINSNNNLSIIDLKLEAEKIDEDNFVEYDFNRFQDFKI